ncbi:Uncharacterized protein Adt_06836 [Abeliophyllum distichum]|uniref:Aminotransferase-like plant mobile domain-containing protein n=1 Tax=Abeliophyllum distichum TaxID=126358 RepID=A0ABD1V826_9LAMI
MATSKNPSDNRINFEDFQELLTRPYVNPSCLLPSKPELNEFYLGPSFNNADSVGTTKAIFDRAKIFDLLEIATRPPLYGPILFPIALSFWSSEYNTFIFPLGPMSITLRDVGALVNLLPLGDIVSLAILISSAAPKFDKKYTDSYSRMQELYNNSGGEPTHAEHEAFFQVWLCKYILCVPSLKPYMAYLPIAHELAHGRSLNLCSLFLAAFYRGMAYLQYQLMHLLSEPLWLAQLWLRAYFPQFGAHPPRYPPAQTGVIRGASSRKRPALGPSERPDDNDDNNDDAPPLIRRNRSSTSPLKDSTPPIPSSPPPSIPSNEQILPEEELEGPETSIAQPVGESSPFQGVVPPSVEPEEILIDFPIVQEPIRPDKDVSSQVVELPSDILSPSSSKVIDESSNEDLFTSWEQVMASHAARSSSASHPYAASAAFSIENMNILKQAVLEYTSFMDMDIVNASATSQRDKFERLNNQMAQALELPFLKLPTDLKLSLKIIYQEISALLAKNVELKAQEDPIH